MNDEALQSNERIKLAATAFNNLGVAFIVADFISPLVRGDVSGNPSVLLLLLWIAVGTALHGIGAWVLGRLWQ